MVTASCTYTYQSFIYSPTDALVSCLKNNIKIYIKNEHYFIWHHQFHNFIILIYIATYSSHENAYV